MFRGLWKGSVSLSLGVLVSTASAQEVEWRPAVRPAPAVRPSESITIVPAAQPAAAAKPAAASVSLDRPVRSAGNGQVPPAVLTVVDQQVEPAAFRAPAAESPRVVARGASEETPKAPPAAPGGNHDLGTVKAALKQGPPPEEIVLPSPTPLAPPPATAAPPTVMPPTVVPGPVPPQIITPTPVAPPVISHPPVASHPPAVIASTPVPPDVCACKPAPTVVADDCCTVVCCDPAPCGWCPGWFGWMGGGRLYGSAEGLVWWTQRDRVPALVTIGDPTDPIPGAIGQPGTQIAFGNGEIGDQPLYGGRVRLGYWFSECERWGLEGSVFYLGTRTSDFSLTSTGVPAVYRPFFNADPAVNLEDAQIVAEEGILAGTVGVTSEQRLWGAEANLRRSLFRGCNYRADLLGGFRHLGMDENLTINEQLITLSPTTVTDPDTGEDITFPAGTLINVSDRFETRNRFYGGQIGLDQEIRWGRFFVDVRTTVALGSTRQAVYISGSTSVNGMQTLPGGLLALPSNTGRFSREAVTFVPEVGVNIGYQVTDYMRVYVGYNFLYWSSVVRPGTEIDRVVDARQLAGITNGTPAVRPAPQLKAVDFWTMGFNAGVALNY